MKTKEFLARTGISESTLRRWLRDGQPIPQLRDAERDWTGQREWTEAHVRSVLAYKERKRKQVV